MAAAMACATAITGPSAMVWATAMAMAAAMVMSMAAPMAWATAMAKVMMPAPELTTFAAIGAGESSNSHDLGLC